MALFTNLMGPELFTNAGLTDHGAYNQRTCSRANFTFKSRSWMKSLLIPEVIRGELKAVTALFKRFRQSKESDIASADRTSRSVCLLHALPVPSADSFKVFHQPASSNSSETPLPLVTCVVIRKSKFRRTCILQLYTTPIGFCHCRRRPSLFFQ